jgi:gas vesicle protein
MPNNTSSSSTRAPDFKDIKDKVTEGAKEAKDAAKSMAQTVASTASNVASKVGEKADDATAAAGRGIQNVADTIREHTPDSGYVGSAARAVSDTIASGGRYLEHEKLSGAMDDFSDVVRRNPVPALLIAMGVGFLLARAMSRS